jgi:coenzyme F420 hydrogenase subunit beta
MSALGHFKDIRKTKAGPAMAGKGPFQNGGTVSALVAMGLREGHITSAALTSRDGLTPIPVLAHTEDEALSCSGSKYMASPTLSSVTKETTNSTMTMAVVGTACQMTALTKMRMNPLNRDDFRDPVDFTIGLFCTWALDTRRLKTLINDKIDSDDILSMDVPPPPAQAMVFTTSKGKVEIPLSEIRTAIPKGCAICPDMTAEFADISVGALEGETGWNTLIVRTEKGASLVAEAVEKGYLIMEPMPELSLSNLEKGAMGKKKRAFAKASEEHCLNVEPDKGRSALVVDPVLVERLLPIS